MNFLIFLIFAVAFFVSQNARKKYCVLSNYNYRIDHYESNLYGHFFKGWRILFFSSFWLYIVFFLAPIERWIGLTTSIMTLKIIFIIWGCILLGMFVLFQQVDFSQSDYGIKIPKWLISSKVRSTPLTNEELQEVSGQFLIGILITIVLITLFVCGFAIFKFAAFGPGSLGIPYR